MLFFGYLFSANLTKVFNSIKDGKITNIEAIESKRFGMVIEVKSDKIDEYNKLHRNVWPGVLEQLEESNIRNYSIFLQQIGSRYYLFSYYEYVGNNYESDMKRMAADSTVQAWWDITESYQIPLDSRQEGEWWTQMEEVFHHE